MASNKGKAVKAATSAASETATKNVGVITRSLARKATRSEPAPLHEDVNNPLLTNKSNEDDSAPSSPRSDASSASNDAPVMTTNASSLEDQIAALTKVIEGLAKHVQEQDARISRVMDKVDKAETSQMAEKALEVPDGVEVSTKQPANDHQESVAKELQLSSDGSIPIDQLKDFIEGTIKNKLEGGTKSTLVYAKPYSTRIDGLKMPTGY